MLGNKDQPSDTGDVEAEKVNYDTIKRGGSPLMLKEYKEQQALEYSMLGVSLEDNGLVFS